MRNYKAGGSAQQQIEKGMHVNVYENPIMLEGFIRTARVTKVLNREDYTDKDGNQIARVRAILRDERNASDWWVSVIAGDQH